MKFRLILAALSLLLALNAGGQTANNISKQKPSQVTATQVPAATSQEQTIAQLQEQVKELNEEMNRYRDDVRSKITQLDDEQDRWLSFLGIALTVIIVVFGAFGVAVPIFIGNRNEKNIDKILNEAKLQAEKAEQKAINAVNALSNIQIQVESVKEQVQKAEIQVESVKEQGQKAEIAAIEAKENQFFAQALSEKDMTRAIKLYTKIIELNPQSSEAYNNRGAAKLSMHEYIEALKDFEKAIEINPQCAEAYCNRAEINYLMGEHAAAIQDHNKAIELKPQSDSFYAKRAWRYYLMNNYSAAILDYDKAIELKPQHEYYFKKAVCYEKMAEQETDEEKKAELNDKAKADNEKGQVYYLRQLRNP